jgi:uncharacterized protein YndB with AHSA1/START domain
MTTTRLTLKTEGDTHIVVTRRFAASREAVYRAHTEASTIQKWLLGPNGWSMPVCVSEARPGGRIRYEWVNEKEHGFCLTGEYVALEPFRRILHVERMHLSEITPAETKPADTTRDNHVETIFEPDGNGTLMTIRIPKRARGYSPQTWSTAWKPATLASTRCFRSCLRRSFNGLDSGMHLMFDVLASNYAHHARNCGRRSSGRQGARP